MKEHGFRSSFWLRCDSPCREAQLRTVIPIARTNIRTIIITEVQKHATGFKLVLFDAVPMELRIRALRSGPSMKVLTAETAHPVVCAQPASKFEASTELVPEVNRVSIVCKLRNPEAPFDFAAC